MLPDPFLSITVQDLPNETLVDVAQVCGLDVVKTLMRNLPGQSIIVPQNGLARAQATARAAGRENGPILAEDLPTNTWRFLANKCGLDTILSVLEKAGNISVIIPKSPFHRLYHRYIHEHFDGSNGMELSILLGLSRSHFYAILTQPDPHRARRAKRFIDPAQTSLV